MDNNRMIAAENRMERPFISNEAGGGTMRDLELTIEALKRCISPETFERAMREIRTSSLCCAERPVTDLKSMAQDLLTKLGVPSHLKGYRFLVTGLEIIVADPSAADLVTKRLYPEIAAAHETTPSRVERGIRHAIETVWDNGDTDDLEACFGRSVSYYKGRPTNSAFLVRSADLLRREFEAGSTRSIPAS